MVSNKVERLISEITDIEWEMFSSVKASEENTCQEKEKTFRLMRWMIYSVCDEKVLESILKNLEEAKKSGRNLMVEKYGMMEGKISCNENNELIDKIASTEADLMKVVVELHPHTFQEKPQQFENYAKCELATYSSETLSLYNEMIDRYETEEINIVEERYNNLFKRLGYESLADKESQEKAKEFWKNNTCRGC